MKKYIIPIVEVTQIDLISFLCEGSVGGGGDHKEDAGGDWPVPARIVYV